MRLWRTHSPTTDRRNKARPVSAPARRVKSLQTHQNSCLYGTSSTLPHWEIGGEIKEVFTRRPACTTILFLLTYMRFPENLSSSSYREVFWELCKVKLALILFAYWYRYWRLQLAIGVWFCLSYRLLLIARTAHQPSLCRRHYYYQPRVHLDIILILHYINISWRFWELQIGIQRLSLIQEYKHNKNNDDIILAIKFVNENYIYII